MESTHPCISTRLRLTVHENADRTSTSIVFGQEFKLPVDLLYGRPPEHPTLPKYLRKIEA